MEKFNILVIPSDGRGGVGFYRSIQPHIQLEEQFPDQFSVTIEMNPNWDDLESFKKYQLIHIHKGLYNNMAAFLKAMLFFKMNGIVTVMDIDDHWKLDFRHPQFAMLKAYHTDELIKNNLKLFDYVTTTTPLFADLIRTYNKNVYVLPNAINPEDERFKIVKPQSDRLRIGMIMGSTHEKDMELIGKISEKLSKEELAKVQFVLCGYDLSGHRTVINPVTKESKTEPIKPKEGVWYRYELMMTSDYKIVSPQYRMFLEQFIPNLDYPNTPNEPYRRCWTKPIDKYYQHYANVDVLLAPLATSEFNYVKSPLKVAECAFSHTAIVASNYGPYTLDLTNAFEKGGTINPEGNALLVDDTKNGKNWFRYIKLLINNPDLVKQLQDNLYNDVHEKYDLRNVTAQRAELYKTFIQEHKPVEGPLSAPNPQEENKPE